MLLQNQPPRLAKPTNLQKQNQTHHSKIATLNQICIDNLESILLHLGLKFSKHIKYLTAKCPVHNGDNKKALQIYTKDGKVPGLWRCCTNHCERKYARNIIGLVQAILEISQSEAINVICSHLGINFDTLEVNESQLDKLEFSRIYQSLGFTPRIRISRKDVRNSLLIPSSSFLERGFSSSLLDRYDIGTCVTRGKKFFTRTIVPIYDEKHEYMIACAARNPNPVCDSCGYCHSSKYRCPTTEYQEYITSKWINDGVTSETLFNYWYAKYYIMKSKTVILTEGIADCLRLEEAGIHNSVAVFGNCLKSSQAQLLDKLGVMNIICLFDNDNGGNTGTQSVIEQYQHMYRIHFPQILPKNVDVGELSNDTVIRNIKPVLKQLTKGI